MSEIIYAPVSLGELVDKITILEIKLERARDAETRAIVARELGLLDDIASRAASDDGVWPLKAELRRVNEILWAAEDRLRLAEERNDFGADFVELARSVYRTNDERARLKSEINTLVGSAIREIKIHPA